MSLRSISPSLPCDSDSELSSSMNEDVPEVLEGGFIPYDENLEPVAIEEEAAALYNFCRFVTFVHLPFCVWSLDLFCRLTCVY